MASSPSVPDNPQQEQTQQAPAEESQQQGDYTGPGGGGKLPDGNLPEMLVTALADICRKMDKRELSARINQVAKAQKARFFWRGIQYLEKANAEQGGSSGTIYAPKDPDSATDDDKMYVFNIYKAKGKVFLATFAQAPAGTRFEANDPKAPSDVESAREAEAARKLICKVNNQKELQRQIALKAWTDGLVVLYSCSGYSGAYAGDKSRPYPKIEVGGALEWKVPIVSSDFDDWDYARCQKEVSLSKTKSDYPGKADKLSAASGGSSKDIDYSRQARVSVAEGLGIISQTGDSLTFNVTKTEYWLRPCAFNEVEDKTVRGELQSYFPTGARVCFVGETYVESADESMDDHVSVFKAVDQDGYNLNGLGHEAIAPQESFNDAANLARITFIHGVPHSFVDQKLVPAEAVKNQKSSPGYTHPVERPIGEPMADCFYQEPNAEAPVTLMQFMDNLQGPLMQDLTGQQPALYGAEMGQAGKTASGYQQALSQAMGLMGLVWVPFKKAWAMTMRQCVRILAEAHTPGTVLSTTLSENNGSDSTIRVSVDNLKGQFLAYPDTDENFPESWTAKKAAYSNLMLAADKNPALAAILSHPDNLRMAKDLVGLPDMTIPGADADEKQQVEIEEMEKQAPVPDPKAIAVFQMAQASGQMDQQALQQAQSQIPLVSSVDIDPDFDDHESEYATCTRWINSPEGQKAKRENPQWFQNVRLHATAHKSAMQQNSGQPEKPPSKSINYKDLTPEGQVQMAAQAGLQIAPPPPPQPAQTGAEQPPVNQ